MCGIFGIVTKNDEALGPILIDAAKRLTYRGYDSVGAATISGDVINSENDTPAIVILYILSRYREIDIDNLEHPIDIDINVILIINDELESEGIIYAITHIIVSNNLGGDRHRLCILIMRCV